MGCTWVWLTYYTERPPQELETTHRALIPWSASWWPQPCWEKQNTLEMELIPTPMSKISLRFSSGNHILSRGTDTELSPYSERIVFTNTEKLTWSIAFLDWRPSKNTIVSPQLLNWRLNLKNYIRKPCITQCFTLIYVLTFSWK